MGLKFGVVGGCGVRCVVVREAVSRWRDSGASRGACILHRCNVALCKLTYVPYCDIAPSPRFAICKYGILHNAIGAEFVSL